MCAKRRPGVTSSRRSRRAFAPSRAAPARAPEGSFEVVLSLRIFLTSPSNDRPLGQRCFFPFIYDVAHASIEVCYDRIEGPPGAMRSVITLPLYMTSSGYGAAYECLSRGCPLLSLAFLPLLYIFAHVHKSDPRARYGSGLESSIQMPGRRTYTLQLLIVLVRTMHASC